MVHHPFRLAMLGLELWLAASECSHKFEVTTRYFHCPRFRQSTQRVLRPQSLSTCHPPRSWSLEPTVLEINYSAFYRHCDGLRAIISAQLGKDVPDLSFYGIFGDRERRGDLLIGIALGDQTQDPHFRGG
jgi:hypothetical protein